MTPGDWRKSEGLTLAEVAAKIGLSRTSVWHYETGQRDPANSVVITYGKISKGKVTARDLHSVRQAWLRAHTRNAA